MPPYFYNTQKESACGASPLPSAKTTTSLPSNLPCRSSPPINVPQYPLNHQSNNQQKINFMAALGLHTPDAVNELKSRRGERKRRSTANPRYSYPMDTNKRRQVDSSKMGAKGPLKKNPVAQDLAEQGEIMTLRTRRGTYARPPLPPKKK